MAVWFFIFVTLSLIITFFLRKERTIKNITNYLNLTGLLLILFVLFPIIAFQLNHGFLKQNTFISKNKETPVSIETKNYTQPVDNSLPDIYYIILDSYMNQDVLKSELGFDNSEFCDWLRARGFFVSSSSRSNYTWTSLSLPSSLNFRYLTVEDKGREGGLLYDNEVMKKLKAKGYKTISINFTSRGCHYYGTDADIRFAYGPAREFLPGLINSSWAYPIAFFGFLNSAIYNYQRESILYSFEKLKEIPEIKGPTFTFAHILSPHPPYIFDREGRPLKFNLPEFRSLLNNKNRGDLWYSQECLVYIDQALFINKQVESALESIISRSPEAIIIVQGDHGQFLGLFDRPSRKLFRLRTSILNAYYLPGDGKKLLYDGISPVNSFRVVFDKYFNENYKLLPDISYYSSSNKLWDFIIINNEDLAR